MRALSILLAMLLAAPSLADDWGHYVNPRFGYAIDIPPGFVGQGESANGDGQTFETPTAELLVFGSTIVEGDFEDEVAARQSSWTAEGWSITYQATTPTWASYSGARGSRVFYERVIPLCGNAVGVFSLRYGTTDLSAFNAIIERLVRSLRQTDGSAACPA